MHQGRSLKVDDVAADHVCCIHRICTWWHINCSDENMWKFSCYIIRSHTDSQQLNIWCTYFVFHWHVNPMTPLLSHKQTHTTSILFARVFSSVASEQWETFHVYMRVRNIIRQPCLCVAHYTTRAVFVLEFNTSSQLIEFVFQRLHIPHNNRWEIAVSLCSSVWLLSVFLSSLVWYFSVDPKTQALSTLMIEAEVVPPLCTERYARCTWKMLAMTRHDQKTHQKDTERQKSQSCKHYVTFETQTLK